MIINASYIERPEAIRFEAHSAANYVWMRRNVREVPDEYGCHYDCDEVYFETSAGLSAISADEERFWRVGVKWPEQESPEADRLDRIEAQSLYTALMTDTLIEED